MKERMWNNRVDEHIIAVREEPILHPIFYQRNVTKRIFFDLFKEFKTARANAQNLSYSLKVNEFTDLDNQGVCVLDEMRTPWKHAY